MKCMHLGEKTEDMQTQRDKPSNLGEKTEDTGELNDTSPPILVRKQRTPVNSTRQALQSWCVKTTTGKSNLCYSNLGLVIDPKKGGSPQNFGHEDFG
ncbi:hypothetical protein TNCV_2748931 [Trichonephila clavipes]|nr:hypothetical protein TNCV_2748931 [Trichonephila clavipes]